ncbi:MAG: Wzy polymerase domain-containing protein [Burkholderiaceae bacterium]|nr:Wzy polymerase domain-containing protein [Burkholderiaceae bacterium]
MTILKDSPALADSVAVHPGPTRLRAVLAGVCVALPWLNPFAPGPSAAIGPWLFSLLCIVLLWLIASPQRGSGRGLIWPLLVALILLADVFRPLPLRAEVLAAVVALLGIMACLRVAADAPHWPGVLRALVWAWLIAALLSSAIGLVQYFNLAGALWPFANVSAAGEAFANLRQRNQFATLTSIGLLALGWLMLRARLGWHAVWMVALLAVGNAASASRTGLVQLIVIVALAWLWNASRERPFFKLSLLALLVYVCAALSLPWLLETATGHAGSSVLIRIAQDAGCNSRSVLYANVIELIAEKPWWGWGWGELDYAHYVHAYSGERFCDILDNAHNLPLHLAVELGLPGAVLICGAALWLFVRARPWHERDLTRQLAWGVLIVIGIHSLLEYPLWYGPFQMALGLALGLLRQTSAATAAGEQQIRDPSRSVQAWTLAQGVLALAALAYATWDYDRISQIYRQPEARRPAYREGTLAKLRSSWLFESQVKFAALTITPVTDQNDLAMAALAASLLHYSPEPRVIEKFLEANARSGDGMTQLAESLRYRRAFPQDYARWRKATSLPPASAPPG